MVVHGNIFHILRNSNCVVLFCLVTPNEGAQVNLQDNNGWTALMYASQGGYVDTAQALLDAGQSTLISPPVTPIREFFCNSESDFPRCSIPT